MGFFSWLTADTNESISNNESSKGAKTVYMLRPDGNHICENSYDGYGVFGGVDAYVQLAIDNAHLLKGDIKEYDEEYLRNIGITLGVGEILIEKETGKYWSVFRKCPVVECEHFNGSYGDIIPEFGKSANELIQEGKFDYVPVKSIVDIKYPLKFSFNPDAIYDELKPSEDCPDQGFFYE